MDYVRGVEGGRQPTPPLLQPRLLQQSEGMGGGAPGRHKMAPPGLLSSGPPPARPLSRLHTLRGERRLRLPREQT